MHTISGISVDAGVSIDGDCDMTHTVTLDCVEIEFGQRTGCLQLCMTEDAVTKLVNIANIALADLRQHRATTDNVNQSNNAV